MSKGNHKEDCESDQVTFCAECYSLRYRYEESIGMDCCMDCGCTDCRTASFEEWERLYKERYGHKYLEIKKDIRKSPLFLMSVENLKSKVFNDPSWKDICKKLYPSFPEGIGRADSVILLFAKLCQDNRVDDIRMELANRNKLKE